MTDRTSQRCEWGRGDILSPHGALRAYTVFLTAEPRRGSSRVLSSSVTVADVSRWRNIFSIMNRSHLPEVRVGSGDVMSPHGALRAYTVLLTAEPRRGSTLVLSSSVTVSDVPRRCNFFRILCRYECKMR